MPRTRRGRISIKPNHVGLVLLNHVDSPFYLEIPLDTIKRNCLDPARYLRFVGWCVLGVEGKLSLEPAVDSDEGAEAEDAEVRDIEANTIYYYVRDENVLYLVDLDVIKMRASVPSETTRTRKDFRAKLLERDVICPYTGSGADYGSGHHIIPFSRGSEWLRLIVEGRPPYGERVDNFNDINDIRNGVFVTNTLHTGLDSRKAVILKTPNPYLQPRDIPHPDPTDIVHNLSDEVSYPRHVRYTLQWLIPDKYLEVMIPNNRDAAFKKHTRKAKPSDLLLHYNYGTATVKWWGHNTEVLDQYEFPRPKAPVAAPSTSKGDRTTRKHGAVRATDGEPEEESGKRAWDEDDVVLFFWSNTRAARERRSKKMQEDAQRMDQWRKGHSYF
ncbi:hypothetical protein APHAL10511_005738 [Amanita phalloides]|nr:hypothetical protein APHAL10511_005738 [Amanita phalloides]